MKFEIPTEKGKISMLTRMPRDSGIVVVEVKM